MGHPPLCRYCGRPIRKRTLSVWFGQHQSRDGYIIERTDFPPDKETVQRMFNQKVVMVRWVRGSERVGRDYISKATLWDGESYLDKYFCTDRCAEWFGRLCAKEGRGTEAYFSAIEAREDKTG